MLKAPELELTEAEAKQYAEGVALVARHYDVGASAKTLDWFNLMTTMGSIYGMRAIAIAARRRAEREGRTHGPMPNGHDVSPAADQPAGGEVDWSLMTGTGRVN